MKCTPRLWQLGALEILKLKKGFLICFTGIDGSGKTTHAKSLIDFLNKEGYSCRYVWAASRPILSLTFFAFTRMLGYWKKTKKGEYTDPLEFAPNELRAKLGALWRCFLFVDFQIKVSLNVRIPLAIGRTVVCDRYVYDMIMELYLSQLYTPRFADIIWKTIPRPAITFLMDVEEEAATSRRQIPTERLSSRRQAFLNMSRVFEVIIVNSNEDFLHNSQQIQAHTLFRLTR